MSLITLRFLKWSCMVCFRIFQHLPFISALLPGLLLIWSFTFFKTIPSHPQSCPVFMANKGLEGNNLVSSPPPLQFLTPYSGCGCHFQGQQLLPIQNCYVEEGDSHLKLLQSIWPRCAHNTESGGNSRIRLSQNEG